MVAGLTSVIVVSADSGKLLLDCVDRVLGCDDLLQLILIDNASTDGWPQQTAAAYDGDARLQLMLSAANIGFGPACNRAAAFAQGDLLLFLNPDCLLATDTIASLRSVLESADGAGIVGAMVVDADGIPSPAAGRRDPTLRRALMTMTGLARYESTWPSLAGVNIPVLHTLSRMERVDAISGACFAIRRDAFDRLGGFDEGYFLHCEDLDLCRRVRDIGLDVLLDRSAEVLHLQGSSSRHRAVFVARHKHHGMWRWFVSHDPAARNPLLRMLVWCGLKLHLGWFRLRHAWSQRSAAKPPSAV